MQDASKSLDMSITQQKDVAALQEQFRALVETLQNTRGDAHVILVKMDTPDWLSELQKQSAHLHVANTTHPVQDVVIANRREVLRTEMLNNKKVGFALHLSQQHIAENKSLEFAYDWERITGETLPALQQKEDRDKQSWIYKFFHPFTHHGTSY